MSSPSSQSSSLSRIPRLRSERPTTPSGADSSSPRPSPGHATPPSGTKGRVRADSSQTLAADTSCSTPVPVHRHRQHDQVCPSPSSSGHSSPVRTNLRYTRTSQLSRNQTQGSPPDLPLPSDRVQIQTPRLYRVEQLQLGPSSCAGRPPRPLQVPPSPVSPTHSASFPTTPQHPHLFRPKPTSSYLLRQAQSSSPPLSPSSSFRTTTALSPPSRYDSDTPSPSPRTHRSQSSLSTPSPRQNHQRHQHRSSLPLLLSPPFLIRRGLIPHRAKPTLAMSIQIHAPAPIMSTRALSPPSHHNPLPRPRSQSRSRSRPSSPAPINTQLPSLPPTSPLARPPMTRPPSRSEKLLRDTLRKAEEQERLASLASLISPPLLAGFSSPALAPAFILNPKSASSAGPPPRRHVRRNTSSSSATDASFGSTDYFRSGQPQDVDDALDPDDDEEMDEVDEQEWLWRTRSATSASSSSSLHLTGQPQPPQAHYYAVRTDNKASGYSRSRAHTDPSGAEKVGLAHAAEIPYGSPVSPRTALQRSAKSAPNVVRGSHSKRTSAEYNKAHDSVLMMKENSTMTPHEAVLKARLEGVLRGAKEQERRARSRDREGSGSGSGSGTSNSMASSRNLSGEGDFFFEGVNEYTVSPVSEQAAATAIANKRSSISHQRRPSAASTRTPSSTHTARQPASPQPKQQTVNLLTPPPTPPVSPASPFNAHTAAAQCRAMDGYVSFATIEGLGVPEGEDDNGEEDSGRTGRWLKWLNVGGGRGRSESVGSMASR